MPCSGTLPVRRGEDSTKQYFKSSKVFIRGFFFPYCYNQILECMQQMML